MPSQTRRSQVPLINRWLALAAVCLAPLILAACSGDANDDARGEAPDGEAARENVDAATGHTLPEAFPAQIPLPEEYMILRNDSHISDTAGQTIGLNIALPGTIEEWEAVYEEALTTAFDNVERQEQVTGKPWRFSGHGFETASLYLNSNSGYLDTDSMDSSELPVMLTLQMSERARED